LADLLKAAFFSLRQVHSGKVEVAQRIFQQFMLRGIEGFVTLSYRLVGPEQPLILAHFGGVFAQFGQACIVSLSQLIAVYHRVHVTYG